MRGRVTNFLATDIRKQGMRRVDNSMHRKSSRLLKNIVILSIENPQSHTDNVKKTQGAENCWHAVHANVRQIARLPEQRCWQKRQDVGKLPTTPAAAQKANFRAKKNLSSRCSSCVWQDARENISRKELLVWGLSPVGVEPTTSAVTGQRSNQLNYQTVWWKL